MEDLRRGIAAVRGRLRFQAIAGALVLAIFLCVAGGASLVARSGSAPAPVFVESDAVAIRTKNTAETAYLDRIVVTTGADTARIKIKNANIELAQQATAPPSPNPGSLRYDSTSLGLLKYRDASSWKSAPHPHVLVYKPVDESYTSYAVSLESQEDDHLSFAIGANERCLFPESGG